MYFSVLIFSYSPITIINISIIYTVVFLHFKLKNYT